METANLPGSNPLPTTAMKRYLIFFYSAYYPNGGVTDLISNKDTFEEAIKFASDHMTKEMAKISKAEYIDLNSEVLDLHSGIVHMLYYDTKTSLIASTQYNFKEYVGESYVGN